MCRDDWSRVEVGLRTAVLRSWGRWQETHLDTDWDDYINARQAALDAVNT